jgi:hypothetical protein
LKRLLMIFLVINSWRLVTKSPSITICESEVYFFLKFMAIAI